MFPSASYYSVIATEILSSVQLIISSLVISLPSVYVCLDVSSPSASIQILPILIHDAKYISPRLAYHFALFLFRIDVSSTASLKDLNSKAIDISLSRTCNFQGSVNTDLVGKLHKHELIGYLFPVGPNLPLSNSRRKDDSAIMTLKQVDNALAINNWYYPNCSLQLFLIDVLEFVKKINVGSAFDIIVGLLKGFETEFINVVVLQIQLAHT